MLSHYITAKEIDGAARDKVKAWIIGTTRGERLPWVGYATTLWVDGKPYWIMSGNWEIREGIKQIFIGNGPAPIPLWAPAALMSIARVWTLDEDETTVRSIHEMLANILANALNPVLLNLAESYTGKAVTEIAVNQKERIVVGRYPNDDGTPGPFRHMSGEVCDVDGPEWLKMKL